MKLGTKVRFLVDGLGASRRDELFAVVEDTYGTVDEGVVAFKHPNQQACRGWVYVEVTGKSDPAEKLYVGVSPTMVEAVP